MLILSVCLVEGQHINTSKKVDFIDFKDLRKAVLYYQSISTLHVQELIAVKLIKNGMRNKVDLFLNTKNYKLSVVKETSKGLNDRMVFKISKPVDHVVFVDTLKDAQNLGINDIKVYYLGDQEDEFVVIEMPQTTSLSNEVVYLVLDLKANTLNHYYSLSIKDFFVLKTEDGVISFPIYKKKTIELYDEKISYGQITLHPYE